MNKLALIFLALLIPLAITSADAYTTKVYKSVRQQKVCLTSIGWCSDYSKRTKANQPVAIAATTSKIRGGSRQWG